MSRLVIDGRFQTGRVDARRLILVDGIEYWVRQKQFDVIDRLTKIGWASRDQLVLPVENLNTIIYRIRLETPLRVVKRGEAYGLADIETPSG